MPDTTFESILAGQLREYAKAGVRPIDRFAIAEGTIAVGRSDGLGKRLRRLTSTGRRSFVLILVGLLILALAASVAVVGSRLLTGPTPRVPHTYRNEFVALPDLSRPMEHPQVVPLVDGRVLVNPDGGDDPTTTRELYDPATGISVPAGAVSADLRYISSAVQLRDGRVLILGDPPVGDPPVSGIFDPTTMRSVAIGPMVTPRLGPATTLLPDGRVLIVGGFPTTTGAVEALRSAELFDPDTLTFSPTGSMGTPGGLLATLPDGRVFVAPDGEGDAAQVYDPTTGTFSAAGSMSSSFGVSSAISLPDGRVVVFGSAGVNPRVYTEKWDPTSRTFSTADNPPGPVMSATLLDDGRIFLVGGRPNVVPSWAGIYDPATEVTSLIEAPRAEWPSMTRLSDGRVLLVGGLRDAGTYASPDGAVQFAPAVPTVQIFQ
jgi:hypothetical protein